MRIITLTTDFGVEDPFVGTMKGVILTISPRAHLVDITHAIPPQDTMEAALALEAAFHYFPVKSVHLAVVDPGVGGPRHGLVVAARRHYFVAPDNGLLTFLFTGTDWKTVRLEEPRYRLPIVSRTFHGRDVFAPAAAYLSLGVPIDRFGPIVTDPVRLCWPEAVWEGEELVGEVIHVDRFGNLLTNIRREELERLGDLESVVVEVSGITLKGLAAYFQDRQAGSPGAIIGSTERLEIFVSEGNAFAELKANKGSRVRVWRR